MTRLHTVREHVRRSPSRSPKQIEMRDRLRFEVAFIRLEDFRVGAILVAALEEAFADWRPTNLPVTQPDTRQSSSKGFSLKEQYHG